VRFLHLYRVINRFKSQLLFLHVLKDAKTEARRALLASSDDELVNAIFEWAINTLNGNHKLTIDEKSNLKKYKSSLRAFENPEISLLVNVNLCSKGRVYCSCPRKCFAE